MDRLWVRLSLVISGFILLSTLIPLITFLIFVLSHDPADDPAPQPSPPGVERPARNPWREIRRDLLRSFLLASGFGIAGGVVVSRILAAPITKLAVAAQAIGAGDLATRVHLKGNTKEIDELTSAFNKMAADLQHAAELRNSLMLMFHTSCEHR
jgi:methyl-accepting chemotaxis protein